MAKPKGSTVKHFDPAERHTCNNCGALEGDPNQDATVLHCCLHSPFAAWLHAVFPEIA